MHFTTDQQTLNDLNIFGKPGSESIFSLFDKTQTRGGSACMQEMFRYPMADVDKINHRVAVLQYYTDSGLMFPFKTELFDVIEQYLENTDERSKLQPKVSSVADKLKGLIAEDPHLKNINAGVKAIQELLGALEIFLGNKSSRQVDVEVDPMRKLLLDADFEGLLKEKKGKGLPYETLAAYDVLLRFRKQSSIRTCLHAIYQLDAYLSIAKLAKERGLCYPVALPADQQEVVLEGVYHPHVKGAIANSLKIDPQGNIIFLTGANMAGKSTLMKSLGIAMYLAHMGFPIAAQKMSFSVRDGIYTSINLPDNLNKGISHFYAEVLRIKKISQELGQNKSLFIIIDELFRGTNVKDAYEATVAITAAFAGKRNCMFVVSTHIMEAGETLKAKCSNIKFVYLPTKMEGSRPVYTYRLESGITEDRHGMIIVNNEGIVELLNKNKPQTLNYEFFNR
ncbi:DNA mismatch repair protein [Solitalea longa]|uniref:DNA mismatch repair protein n=2 Tax=Solitalea longa TaxID=2079460 RepID=A0A2S5A6B8_9SPHI|nr:DNA mismatch repair protein [Solitalea longa]